MEISIWKRCFTSVVMWECNKDSSSDEHLLTTWVLGIVLDVIDFNSLHLGNQCPK